MVGCMWVIVLLFAGLGLTGITSGDIGMGLVFLAFAPGFYFLMSKAIARRDAKRLQKITNTKPSQMYPSVKAHLEDRGDPYAHFNTDEWMEHYRQQRDSKVFKKHFDLTEKLQNAPASKQERFAEELVRMSVASRNEFLKFYPNQPLPTNLGFYRLAVNYEKQRKFQEAIAVCRVAIEQEWAGDWEKRIERCEGKLAKLYDAPGVVEVE